MFVQIVAVMARQIRAKQVSAQQVASQHVVALPGLAWRPRQFWSEHDMARTRRFSSRQGRARRGMLWLGLARRGSFGVAGQVRARRFLAPLSRGRPSKARLGKAWLLWLGVAWHGPAVMAGRSMAGPGGSSRLIPRHLGAGHGMAQHALARLSESA